MRIVLQRVSSSSVSVDGRVIGSIGKGICALVGIGDNDSEKDVTWCKDSILQAKLWPDEDGKPWKKNVKDLDYSVLVISQFTLYAKSFKKGKLDFHHAMPPIQAKELYNAVVDAISDALGPSKVQTGEFGAMMDVSLVNDGPVTILFDSVD